MVLDISVCDSNDILTKNQGTFDHMAVHLGLDLCSILALACPQN